MGSSQNAHSPAQISSSCYKISMMGRSIENKRQARNLRKKRRRQQRSEDRATKRVLKINEQLETVIHAARKETDSQKQLALKYSSLWRKSIKDNKELRIQLLHKKNERVRRVQHRLLLI